MESSYTVPPDRMEARQLYKSENWYFYNVLQNYVKGDQGLIHIRKHELTLDGREAFHEMNNFYERKENLTLIQTNFNSKLSKMRLDQNYKDGPPNVFHGFQNVSLDLEKCTGKSVPDEEKIGALNASITLSLIKFAEKLKPSTSKACESNKLQKTGWVGREME
eukprot:15332904-Ditylum_brightwellii.AAC.1